MNWLGKLIGGAAGMALGGPALAAVGLVVGHQVDARLQRGAPKKSTRTQSAFINTTFEVMGHVCKVDGRVSEAEIAMATTVMDRMALSPVQRRDAMNRFRHGKRNDFVMGDVLTRFREQCQSSPMLLGMFMDVQLGAALADGDLTQEEEVTLRFIAVRLGIPSATFEQMLRAARIERRYATGAGQRRSTSSAHSELDEAYSVLGIDSSASDQEVKQAYRRLLSQHHPDKIAAADVSEEMQRLANEKTLRIRRAYERIQSIRGAA
ncbi:MAG: co-chaperone DjlA [Gammaproteobacteria bacterium]